MMTKANKICLIIGILFIIFGFFVSLTGSSIENSIVGLILMIPGGTLIFLALIIQKKYKGSKL